jgi:hypothetical protein
MRIRLSFILLTLFFVIAPVHAAKESITLELTIASAFSQYADTLFESPAYAALAFQNSGMPISLSRPMKILSPKELQIGSDRLIFESKKGNIYIYKITVGLPFGREIAIPVQVEVTNTEGSKLSIRAYPLGSELVPQNLIIKIESKLQSLANINAQKNLIDYLAARTKGRLDSSETKSQLFSQITFDAINQMNLSSASPRNGGDVGQAESLSNQLPLIIAIAIWMIGLPIGLYLIRRYRLRNTNSQSVK